MRHSRPLPTREPVRLPLALLLPAMVGTALLGTALLASAPLAAQQVYKWKDAAGVTHFTAAPPPQGQRYETREVDHQEAVPQVAREAADAEATPAPATEEDPGCATARGNLELLKGNSKVMVDSNGDGKPDKALSDADRTRQRNLAEATLAVKCTGSDATQPAEPEER